MHRYLFTVFLLISSLGLAAQQRYESFEPTEILRRDQAKQREKNAPKRKKVSVIIKSSTKGILYGNPCQLEETRRMGFQYTVQNKGLPGSLKPITLAWHNTKVFLKLTFTKSPFWKLILNQRVKDCREKTGDWRG
ncbi:MAG: hypothetical protein ACI8QD_002424 [Cyclobacteriaceae bacterium]|jgi:hypothetical protein